MKKLFATLISALLIGFAAFGAGCSNSGWKEVQSITYQTSEGNNTITSICVCNITREIIDTEEYKRLSENQEEIPDEISNLLPYGYYNIGIDRNLFLQEVKASIGKTYYYIHQYLVDSKYYNKFLINEYNLHYVKVKFLDKEHIEINYYKDSENDYITINVKPLSYTITYFND